MPTKSFEPSEAADAQFAPLATMAPAGTVLKPFNGPTRRFVVDHVVTDADISDLPMSLDDLKTGGFIS